MARFTKRKRVERAHRYRVLAQQLDFHLTTKTMGDEADACVQAAKEALLNAAAALERAQQELEMSGAAVPDMESASHHRSGT
jgi:hypothetical protein